VGGWQLARAALIAHTQLAQGDDAFLRGKIASARFFADHALTQAASLQQAIAAGGAGALDLASDAF
jgi:3-(methylthio)propanoyl-CoA dehydrogenase